MRLISRNERAALPTCKAQRLFIEAWYSMVNKESLDSYRAKCMGTISILEELLLLLQSQNESVNEKYIGHNVEEIFKIFSADAVIKIFFGNEKKLFLEQLSELKKTKDYKLYSYFVRDFLDNLKNQSNYRLKLISELENSIFNTRNEDEIVELTSSLLSDLINSGYPLESLKALIDGIFINNNSSQKPFVENFEFLKKIIKRQDSVYTIILRLKGSKKRDHIPANIGNISIKKEVDAVSTDRNVNKILKPDTQYLFAEIMVNACDDRAAGLKAKQELNKALDLLRFEFEEAVVSIPSEFVSIRENVNGNKPRAFGMPDLIPNPQYSLGSQEISTFIYKVESILDRDSFSEDGKSKIKAALRFIRTGKDAEVLENKFLNWWTALEYLTVRAESSKKIHDVEKYLTAVSVVEYLEKHLYHIKQAIDYTQTAPSAYITENYQVHKFAALKSEDFFDVLMNENEVDILLASLDSYEMLKFRLSKLVDTIKNKKISQFLKNHENNVKWQINRIYRIRNAIVHNADHTLNLPMIAANLEYYLRRVFLFLINTVHQIENCKDLTEIYDRVHYTSEKIKNYASDNEVVKKLLVQKIF